MRFAFAAVFVGIVLVMAGVASAQPNDCTTVVLHAVAGFDGDCQTDVDCTSVAPTVRVDSPAGMYSILMYIRNFDSAAGVQVAFDWPGTWAFQTGIWTCQPGQLSGTTPTTPGARDGTLSTAFDPISGGALAAVGIFIFGSIGDGCLSIIESEYPDGNHIVGADQSVTAIRDVNEGKVCVNADGVNACECIQAAVEPATWGQIKASYGN